MHVISLKLLGLDHAVFPKQTFYVLNPEKLSDIHTPREKIFLGSWCSSLLYITKKPLNTAQLSVTALGRSICKNKQVTANMHC